MAYRMAGIDVHKKKLAVVVADVEIDEFERRWFGSNPKQLRVLSVWLIEQQVEDRTSGVTNAIFDPVKVKRKNASSPQRPEAFGRP
jgi:hypothetical protein